MTFVRAFNALLIEATAQEVLDVLSAGTTFDPQSVTITAEMVDGTDPVLTADPNRRSLRLRAPTFCTFSLHEGSSDIAIELNAEQSRAFVGAECPRNAIYLVAGLVETDRLTIEVG